MQNESFLCLEEYLPPQNIPNTHITWPHSSYLCPPLYPPHTSSLRQFFLSFFFLLDLSVFPSSFFYAQSLFTLLFIFFFYSRSVFRRVLWICQLFCSSFSLAAFIKSDPEHRELREERKERKKNDKGNWKRKYVSRVFEIGNFQTFIQSLLTTGLNAAFYFQHWLFG